MSSDVEAHDPSVPVGPPPQRCWGGNDSPGSAALRSLGIFPPICLGLAEPEGRVSFADCSRGDLLCEPAVAVGIDDRRHEGIRCNEMDAREVLTAPPYVPDKLGEAASREDLLEMAANRCRTFRVNQAAIDSAAPQKVAKKRLGVIV